MLFLLFNNLNFKHLFLQKDMLWYLVMVLTASEMAVSPGLNCKVLLAKGGGWFFEVSCFVLVREGPSLSLALTGYRHQNKRRTGCTSNFSSSILLSSHFTSLSDLKNPV